MTTRNRPRPLLLACLATTTLLTACTTGSPEAGRPNTNPPSTPTATSSNATPTTTSGTSAPTSAPPSRPSAADGLTLAAAEAFIRHYIDLMNYASQTGDGAPLLAASESGCEGCKQYAAFAAKVNGANGGLSGDYFERVTEVTELVKRDSGHLGGSAKVTVGAYTTKESPTAQPVTSTPASYTEQIALSPAGGNWVMYEIKLEDR
ncbi:DUF6318 family protein [Kribbella sp. NPDC050820]|uniref:DUF6318 family protein n=1 Tax=Kribbella sp. NPDC050820 TaxID=3155408 RepID=UPI0033D0F20D